MASEMTRLWSVLGVTPEYMTHSVSPPEGGALVGTLTTQEGVVSFFEAPVGLDKTRLAEDTWAVGTPAALFELGFSYGSERACRMLQEDEGGEG